MFGFFCTMFGQTSLLKILFCYIKENEENAIKWSDLGIS